MVLLPELPLTVSRDRFGMDDKFVHRPRLVADYLSSAHKQYFSVASLFESGATTKAKHDAHKVVVGRNEFTAKNVTVQAHAFTKSAREAIEAAGGKCEVLKLSTGAVIEA